MTDKVQKIKDWISKEQDGLMDANGNFDNPSDEGAFHILTNLDYYIDSLQEEPVNEDLEEAANNALERMLDKYGLVGTGSCLEMFRLGTEWKKEHLWKPADGDDLPEIDREVIALLDNGKVVFAHRPPEYWDGKDIVTGKVTRNYVKTYGKGVWNIPDVVLWLDLDIPQL